MARTQNSFEARRREGVADPRSTGHVLDRWVSDREVHAATVCLRGAHSAMEVIEWTDAAEARETDEMLLDRPCGPDCHGQHLVAWSEPRRVVCLPGCHALPPSPPI